jgi:hypothetical protein
MPCQHNPNDITELFSTLSIDSQGFAPAENSSKTMHLCFGLSLTTALAVVGRLDLVALQIGTTSGQVTGFINDTAPNVRQFLGIPFSNHH